ncbi:MAG: hypothetical protein J6Q94_05540 [Clostridia bacterium]|nr:hypothetical protein [Clostridia bacterium]
MKDEEKKPELHVVGEDENPITEIPDDSKDKRNDERKRKAARFLKKIDSSRVKNTARLSPVAYAVIIVLIFVFVYVIADLCSGGFLYTANGRFVSFLTKNSSQEFSVETNADTIYDFESYGNGFVMLTENGITYVKKSGNVSSSQQLTYSSPSLEINDDRVVVYDRGNNSYLLMRNENIYSQQKTDERIIDFALSSKDNYAIAVRDKNSKSVLYGMDAKGKVIFQWNCPHGYITDVVITSSGGKVAVTVLNAENAVLGSTVYVLDFEYDSAYAQFDYKNETVLGTKFITNKKIQVVTDKNVYLISGKDQKIVYEYGTADICFSDFGEKYSAVITKDYSHDDYYLLSLFSKTGKLKYSVPVNGKVRGLSVSDKSVSVLFADKTETYSKWGKLVGSAEEINHFDDIVLNGNYMYVLSADTVLRYPAYGSVSDSETVIEEETR